MFKMTNAHTRAGKGSTLNEFVIATDSAADLSAELVQELGVEVYSLSFTMDGVTRHDRPDQSELPVKTFYDRLRAGSTATTAAVNVSDFTGGLAPALEAGRDVLILSFSSALSATCQSAQVAARELQEAYPGRRIYVVDSLAASLGVGLLLWHAARLRRSGASIEDVRDWLEANKLHLCHWFTVDDLHFLKRGGRVSAATAVLGTMLSIKPVLHVDDGGRLIKVGTARGRAASLRALVDHMEETVTDPSAVFLSHGDCEEDALQVAEDVKRRFGTEHVYINTVGPVIGAHTGPGVVALFFLGRQR